MRFLRLLIGFIVLFYHLASQGLQSRISSIVILQGTVKNFDSQIEVEDMSDLSEFVSSHVVGVIVPDINKSFRYVMNVKRPNYYRIGRNILYLSPGDSMNVFLDSHRPDSSTFSGKGSSANNYLRFTPFPKAGSFLNGGEIIRPVFKETYNIILDSASKRDKALNLLENVSTEFKHLEQLRIKADIINSLVCSRDQFPYDNHMKDKDSIAEFSKELDSYLEKAYDNTELEENALKLVVYRYIAGNLLSHHADSIDKGKNIKEYLAAKQLANKMLRLKSRGEILKIDSLVSVLPPTKYKRALSELSDDLIKFREGDLAKELKFINSKGDSLKLSKFKGKVIYIDLWATWCEPCLAEMPYLDTLMEKFKNDENIVFISLSIDDSKSKWKSFIQKRTNNGVQGLIKRLKMQDYNLTTIPRIIIIDKKYRINSLFGSSPSDLQSEKILRKLLMDKP